MFYCYALVVHGHRHSQREACGPRHSRQMEWKKIAQPFCLCKRDKYIRESLMFSNCDCECD